MGTQEPFYTLPTQSKGRPYIWNELLGIWLSLSNNLLADSVLLDFRFIFHSRRLACWVIFPITDLAITDNAEWLNAHKIIHYRHTSIDIKKCKFMLKRP